MSFFRALLLGGSAMKNPIPLFSLAPIASSSIRTERSG
jgi:hypothetical protein